MPPSEAIFNRQLRTMLEKLKGLFGRVNGSGMTQPQREALVDLLLWTMYVDRVLALPENERIERVGSETSWDSATPFPQYLNASLARVRGILADDAKAEAFLEDIYERLGSSEMRRQAYEACRTLAQSDGEVAEEERRFLERIRERFDLHQAA